MIINKWWFYILGIVKGLRVVLWVVAALSLATTVATFLSFISEPYISFKAFKTLFIPALIATLITTLMAILIPTQETIVNMKVAEFATYDNVELTVEGIKNATDYVFDKIQEIQK